MALPGTLLPPVFLLDQIPLAPVDQVDAGLMAVALRLDGGALTPAQLATLNALHVAAYLAANAQ